MPRARGTKQYQPLSQGLITEASPLAFPQGATIDELNFVFEKEGAKRVRRKGLSSSFPDTRGIGGQFSLTFWEEQEIFIVYNTDGVIAKVYFFDKDFQLIGDLDTEVSIDVQFTPLNSEMVMTFATGDLKPRVFVKTDDAIIQYSISIFVRDFELLDDGLSITDRPPTLSEEHQYNLYNAGWYQDRKTQDSGNTLVDPVEYFSEAIAVDVSISSADFSGNTISSTDDSMLVFEDVVNGTDITVAGATEPANNGTFAKTGFNIDETDPMLPVYELMLSTSFTAETGAAISLSTGSGAYPSNADISILGMTLENNDGREIFSPQRLVEQTFGNSPAPRGHYVYDISDFDREDRRTNKTIDGAEDDTLTLINQIAI